MRCRNASLSRSRSCSEASSSRTMRLSVATSSGKCSASVGGRPAAAGAERLMPIRTYADRIYSPTDEKKSGRHWPSACSTRSRRRRRRQVVAFRPLGVLPIDAIQQHGQFSGAQGDSGLAFGRHREAEGSSLQPLINNHVSVAVPIEQLDSIAAAIAKNKNMPRQGVIAQVLPDQLGQGGEALA